MFTDERFVAMRVQTERNFKDLNFLLLYTHGTIKGLSTNLQKVMSEVWMIIAA